MLLNAFYFQLAVMLSQIKLLLQTEKASFVHRLGFDDNLSPFFELIGELFVHGFEFDSLMIVLLKEITTNNFDILKLHRIPIQRLLPFHLNPFDILINRPF